MVTVAIVAVEASRKAEWMTDAGVGLKGEMIEEKPFPRHVD